MKIIEIHTNHKTNEINTRVIKYPSLDAYAQYLTALLKIETVKRVNGSILLEYVAADTTISIARLKEKDFQEILKRNQGR